MKKCIQTREQRGTNIIGRWGSQWEIAQLFKVGRSSYYTRTQLIRIFKLHCISRYLKFLASATPMYGSYRAIYHSTTESWVKVQFGGIKLETN